MDLGAAPCAVISIVALVGLGALAYGRRARSGQSSLLVGSIAHVAVRIPENGVGLIALVVGSRRTTMPARCSESGGIARSTEVAIVDVRGGVAVVCPMD